MEPSPSGTAAADTGAPEASLAGLGSSRAGGSAAVAGGAYLDNALPITQFRLRFDAAYGDNRPDRGEFFYAKCGCFGGNAPGPPLPEKSVDYQDISTYFELAINNRFSGFVELPVRFINPEVNENASGIGDMFAGFKWALVACPDRYVTFQFTTTIPTGNPRLGLGTDHVSLEPGLLFWQRITERFLVQAELKDWIPIGGTDFAANIVTYGVAASYDIYNNGRFWIEPVVELVGWTLLSGQELNPDSGMAQDATGETIVNGKFGLRLGFGNNMSIYAGYGRALTGDVWYKDIFRLEYRLAF